jgi:hypothetical protein
LSALLCSLTLSHCRYGGGKLERARDLFETALRDAPPEKAKPLFLEYAALEEQHGLARHAMEVYERAIPAVPKGERMSVVELYVSRATDFFGVAKVGCLRVEGFGGVEMWGCRVVVVVVCSSKQSGACCW